MTLRLIYDTETTGLPDYKNPSEAPQQPHIVQLAAVLLNTATMARVASLDLIIRPESWTIPQEVIDIHGITQERAMDEGVSEDLAVEMLMELWAGRPRIAYNESFDQRIIRIALKRYPGLIPNFAPHADQAECWKAGESECAMKMANQLIPGKWPKLHVAYSTFFGEEMQNAHSAMGDVDAAIRVWKHCVDVRNATLAA